MQPEVFCLGAINLDLTYRLDDLAGFLQEWGTGLTRGGEEALSRTDEARLRDLLPQFGPAYRPVLVAARRPTPPMDWPASGSRWPWWAGWGPTRTEIS